MQKKSKAIGQKMQSKRNFHGGTGHLAPVKRALLKSWEGGCPPPAPGYYAPVSDRFNWNILFLSLTNTFSLTHRNQRALFMDDIVADE
jgi:hypothetical protein